MRKLRYVFPLLALVGCASAPTTFQGAAHVNGGAAKCTTICQGWGMDLAGMIAVGEYSDGCICQVKGKTVSLLDVGSSVVASTAATKADIDRRNQQAAQAAQANNQ
jgi:hypothetical protein